VKTQEDSAVRVLRSRLQGTGETRHTAENMQARIHSLYLLLSPQPSLNQGRFSSGTFQCLDQFSHCSLSKDGSSVQILMNHIRVTPTVTLGGRGEQRNLALVLNDQGRYEEAEAMHGLTLELKETVLGEDYPHTLESMSGSRRQVS
jgi:hypothetical protein